MTWRKSCSTACSSHRFRRTAAKVPPEAVSRQIITITLKRKTASDPSGQTLFLLKRFPHPRLAIRGPKLCGFTLPCLHINGNSIYTMPCRQSQTKPQAQCSRESFFHVSSFLLLSKIDPALDWNALQMIPVIRIAVLVL